MNKMIAIPQIPKSDLVKEDQDTKMCVDTELCGVQTTETKISKIWLHLNSIKTLNHSTQGKSCMQHKAMIML